MWLYSVGTLCSYQAIGVEGVVGELEFVETNWVLHPPLPKSRRIRMDEEAVGEMGFGHTVHLPSVLVPLQEAPCQLLHHTHVCACAQTHMNIRLSLSNLCTWAGLMGLE